MTAEPQQTILIPEHDLQRRIMELADQINQDYAGETIVFVGVLTGSFIFLSDLIRKITTPLKVGFLSLSSYQGETSAQTEVQEHIIPLPQLNNQNVIVVEDIFDTGNSLKYAYKRCSQENPKTLKTCVLLIKEGHHTLVPKIDYHGFTIPNVFVVGYGLDYQDHYRQLPDIVQLIFDNESRLFRL